MKLHRLRSISLTVADLSAAMAFYTAALDFTAGPEQPGDPALARLLGADFMRRVRLGRGDQCLDLVAFEPAGAPYPAGSRSNDLWFQHCALTTPDIGVAYRRLQGFGATPISTAGPEQLPPGAGSVTAYKFRDPEGHPLELIAFPDRAATKPGIDHSAIAVRDTVASIAFYTGLGLRVGSKTVNRGATQDALDGLTDTVVDVVAMLPAVESPHLELLGYRNPIGRAAPACKPSDVAATLLVFETRDLGAQPSHAILRDGRRAALLHDPDGHALLVLESPASG